MDEMVLTRAVVNIYFNDSVQSYLYNVGDQNSIFQIVKQDGFKYCFQDPGSFRYIMNKIRGTIDLSVESAQPKRKEKMSFCVKQRTTGSISQIICRQGEDVFECNIPFDAEKSILITHQKFIFAYD
ncbi:Hypothetical_protein [Hexamita inflata]|uniref:Hypothetical_protein n=1 Tax=Hexamita inflata TaxID=28002 RepID=A0AA86UY71_9EUKA|nr:Hypothetical protein HINF_LOCUS56882 [Hexamita inflata]